MADSEPGSAWALVARVLGFPFRGGALAAALVFSVLFLVAAKAGIFGLWLAIVLAYGYLSYCFHLLESVATGRGEPPVLSIEMMNPAGDWRPLALAMTVSVYLGLWKVAGTQLPAGFVLALGLTMVVALPGVAVVLALESSLSRTLNPLVLIGAAWNLGLYYLAALAVAAVVGIAANVLIAAHMPSLSWIFLLLLGIGLVSSILGGGLYWRRLELNVPTVASPEQTRARAERERNKELSQFLDEVYRELRGGERQRAYQLLREYLARPGCGLRGWQEIFQAVCAWHDPLLLRYLGQDYLTQLLSQGETSTAVDVMGQCLALSPAFRPGSGAEALRLAELARLAGRHAMSRTLLGNFERDYPGHPGAELARKLLG